MKTYNLPLYDNLNISISQLGVLKSAKPVIHMLEDSGPNEPSAELLHGLDLFDAILSPAIAYDEDIFAELDPKVFDDDYNKQMAVIMRNARNLFYGRLIHRRTKNAYPKFFYSYNEEDEAELIMLSTEWDDGSAMAYFSFDKNIEDSNFGLIWNDVRTKNYESRSGNIYLNSDDDIVHEVIDFIFRAFDI